MVVARRRSTTSPAHAKTKRPRPEASVLSPAAAPVNVDLNGLLGNIISCDETVKAAIADEAVATAKRLQAEAALKIAQGKFDRAVAKARGISPGALLEAAGITGVASPQASVETAQHAPAAAERRVKMGPLPPTSPALRPGFVIGMDPESEDDRREDQIYDPQ